jgi:hypothetical protein
MTIPGELARVTGLSRPEAGLGNRALVAEGYATMPAYGTYCLSRTIPADETWHRFSSDAPDPEQQHDACMQLSKG